MAADALTPCVTGSSVTDRWAGTQPLPRKNFNYLLYLNIEKWCIMQMNFYIYPNKKKNNQAAHIMM